MTPTTPEDIRTTKFEFVLLCLAKNGGHLKPVTLKPVIRIFRVFVSAFSVFSALRSLLRPLFSWGGRDVRIFRIFAVSGLNR